MPSFKENKLTNNGPGHFSMRFNIVMLTAIAAFLLMSPTSGSAIGSIAAAEQLADTLMHYQLPDGGILVDHPRTRDARVVPYFANFAALGWTETAAATTDTVRRNAYLQATRDWMDWYAEHQNDDGTIYDFEGTSTSLHATGDYDSTDSYPATYAMLMWRYYIATNDKDYLREKLGSLDGAYSAMFLTMDAEGLTYAKPGFYYRYLMDNCEVASGLAAFQKIFTLLGQEKQAAHAHAAREKLKGEFGSMYRPDEGVFGFALDPFGRISGNFSKGYPDAMANLFALAFLAPQSPKAAALLDKVETTFWDRADAHDFPQWWLWAAMACGDEELQKKALDRLTTYSKSQDAHSFLIGMAAATYCSGLESIRHPEAVCDWEQLTAKEEVTAAQPSSASLAGDGTSLFITNRNSSGTISGAGWRTISLAMPTHVNFEITTSAGYLLLNLVFDPPLDLTDADGIRSAYTIQPGVPVQLRATLIEQDHDWWSAPVPATAPGENTANISFSNLTRSPWGQGGDGKFSAGAVRGIRLQFDNKAQVPVSGILTLDEISITRGASGAPE